MKMDKEPEQHFIVGEKEYIMHTDWSGSSTPVEVMGISKKFQPFFRNRLTPNSLHW